MITTPDYNNCIVNFSNSILKYYGVKEAHQTLGAVDRIINKNYRNVVIIILDGLGMDALNHHLKPDDFLRKNLYTGISSVFPSSTTPGLLSFETSQMPIEHGWLGETPLRILLSRQASSILQITIFLQKESMKNFQKLERFR